MMATDKVTSEAEELLRWMASRGCQLTLTSDWLDRCVEIRIDLEGGGGRLSTRIAEKVSLMMLEASPGFPVLLRTVERMIGIVRSQAAGK